MAGGADVEGSARAVLYRSRANCEETGMEKNLLTDCPTGCVKLLEGTSKNQFLRFELCRNALNPYFAVQSELF